MGISIALYANVAFVGMSSFAWKKVHFIGIRNVPFA